jgi:hypothetical protein
MTVEKHIGAPAVRRQSLDPLEVLAPEPRVSRRASEHPQGERPQGSFELAWRLAH